MSLIAPTMGISKHLTYKSRNKNRNSSKEAESGEFASILDGLMSENKTSTLRYDDLNDILRYAVKDEASEYFLYDSSLTVKQEECPLDYELDVYV